MEHRSASKDYPEIPGRIGVGEITRGIARFPCDSTGFLFHATPLFHLKFWEDLYGADRSFFANPVEMTMGLFVCNYCRKNSKL